MLRPNRGFPQGAKQLLGKYIPPTKLTHIIEVGLPVEYQKFYKEWLIDTPEPVHFTPKPGRFERMPDTGEVLPVQNIPFPLKYPPQIHEGIWGGEAVIQGFQKREPTRRRVPHFWVPFLKKSVLQSIVLDRFLSVVVTERTIELVHKHQGFDKYLLETKACDLYSLLALKLKRQILLELKDGCPSHRGDPEKQDKILREYGHYAEAYTLEELEWYGLSEPEARRKLRLILEAANQPVAFKHAFRQKLFEKLKNAESTKAEVVVLEDGKTIIDRQERSSWISKLNPFSKK